MTTNDLELTKQSLIALNTQIGALVTLIVVGTKADGSVGRYRNIRMFSRSGNDWLLELWYNYDLTSL